MILLRQSEIPESSTAIARLNNCPLPTAHCPLCYVAQNRAHHADIGRRDPGSMGMPQIFTAKACAFRQIGW